MGARHVPFLAIVGVSAVFGSVLVSRAAAGTSPSDPARSTRVPHVLASQPPRDLETTPLRISTRPIYVRTKRGNVLAYPPGPQAEQGAPTVVYLHGVRGRAKNGCPYMRSGPEAGWLVCPEPKVKAGAGWSWTGKVNKDAPIVSNALWATRSKAPRVAVGFSQGAYLTLDLLKKKKERFRSIVLLGASVKPRANMLRKAGVKRVVLGASKDEPWYRALQLRAKKLERGGVESRFVSLGHVGHMYAGEEPQRLRDAIAWASEI